MRSIPPVQLRTLTATDAGTFASWAEDESFCHRAEWEPGRGRAHYVDFHRRIILDPPAELLRLGVVESRRGALVGFVDLHGHSMRTRELGYLIGPSPNWGRGLGHAAAQAGLTYGSGVLRLEQIWAEARASNHASVRILKNLAMRETTNGPQENGPRAYAGMRRFEITADEFASRDVPWRHAYDG